MKKFICGLIIGLLLATSVATLASGQALRLIVNGEDITAEAQPVIIDGRTLVPARALAEKLGAKVEWDGVNQTVTVASIKAETAYTRDSVDLSSDWVSSHDLHLNYNLSVRYFAEDPNTPNIITAAEVFKNTWTPYEPILRVSIAEGTLVYHDAWYIKKAFLEEQLRKAGLI